MDLFQYCFVSDWIRFIVLIVEVRMKIMQTIVLTVELPFKQIALKGDLHRKEEIGKKILKEELRSLGGEQKNLENA